MNRLILAALLILFIPAQVLAHGLSIWSEVKNGKLTIEVNYSSGKPASNLPVEISTVDDSKVIATGVTTKAGIWITEIVDPKKKLKIVAGKTGHHKKTSYFEPEDATSSSE